MTPKRLLMPVMWIVLLLLAACVSKDRYAELQTQSLDTQSRLESANQRIRNLETLLATTEAEKKDCQNTSTSLQTRVESLENQNQELVRKVEDLGFEVEKQKSLIALQENVINQMDDTRAKIENAMKAQLAAKEITIQEIKDKLKVTFIDKILFETGSVRINPRGQNALSKIAGALTQDTAHEIIIQGHTDDVPIGEALAARFPTNWELSTARAAAVARFLQEKGGIAPERLSACGFGYYRPVASNDTPEGRRQNRRIEIILAPLDKEGSS